MMKGFFILLVALVAFGCKPHKKQSQAKGKASSIFHTENPTYTQNVKDLLNDFQFYKEETRSPIILVNRPVKFKDVGNFLKDSTSFTPFEIKYIKEETDYLSNIDFQNNLGKNVNIIPLDTINSIFKNQRMAWAYFHKNYGNAFMSIAHPVFLKNNTECILYLNYSCGGLCGEEQIRLYKKLNNKWICIKTGYGWIS